MAVECKKIIMDEKRLKALRKKPLGERNKIMQQRAKACQMSRKRMK